MPGTTRFVDESGAPLARNRWPSVRAARGESIHGEEYTLQTPTGHRIVEVRARHAPPIRGRDGFALVSMFDVTSHKDVERSLRKSLAMRNEFIEVASHELRTPLTPLLLELELLLRRASADNAPAQPRLAKALRHGRRLDRLVRELLDVANIESGRTNLELQSVSLAEIVHDVVNGLALDGNYGARCEVEVRAPDAVVGHWDPLRLEQITTNLIHNALKFSGTHPVDVIIDARGRTAELHVIDQGPGIAPADRQRVFGKFERSCATQLGGLGLGLWVVHELVDAMGGRISLESQLGQGSTFSVYLPLDGPRGGEPVSLTSDSRAPAAPGR
jgi:signal transduction histidine kinase